MDDNNTVVKRGRGRPRKNPEIEKEKEKEEGVVKRGRGRPRKYPIMERERGVGGEVKPVLKKVDSGYLMKHMLSYFTKLLVLHHELSRDMGKYEAIFKRLKNLDFQMAEVCKTVLMKEYHEPVLEEKAMGE